MTDDGINLLKHFEGLRTEAYPDPATGAEPWTIGYGCTKDVKEGDCITPEMADVMLLREVASFEKGVRDLVKYDLDENQISALTCFAYNVGLGNLQSSTMLKMINSGSVMAAADQFPRWNMAAGKVMPGLIKRRDAERRLYLGEPWDAQTN
jgi:lysozyme